MQDAAGRHKAGHGEIINACHFHDQIRQPLGGVEGAGRFGAPAPWRRAAPDRPPARAISAASRSGREIALLDADRAAGLLPARRHWRTGPDRAHAAAAPGSPAGRWRTSSATVEAPERETTRCAAAMRAGRSAKNGATLGGDAEPRIERAHRVDILGARLLHDAQARAQIGRQDVRCAGGTISAMTRAPWLPPNTSRLQRPPGCGAAYGVAAAAITSRPHRIAGEGDLGCRRGSRLAQRREAGGDRA